GHGRTRVLGLPRPLPPAAAVAGGRLRGRGVRVHLEPPVVPALPVGVQPGRDRRLGGAPRDGGHARARLAVLARALAAVDAAAAVDDGGAGVDRSPLPQHPCAGGRLGQPCRVLPGVRRRAAGQPGRGLLGGAGEAALALRVRGACRGHGLHGPARGGAGAARRSTGAPAAAGVVAGFPRGPRAVLVDGADGIARLGPSAAGPALAVAAVRDRGGVSLVRAAPEPDRGGGVLAVSLWTGPCGRTAAGTGHHDRRVCRSARTGDPPHAAAAAAVRSSGATARRAGAGPGGAPGPGLTSAV